MIRVLLYIVALCFSLNVLANEVNVYSARKEALIKPLLDQFSQQTGIKVNLITGKADALLQRLKREGQYSPADILITTDVGRLYRAQQLGLLQPITLPNIDSLIDASYRDSKGYWLGLSLRVRTVVVAKDRVESHAISRYEDLADKKWHKKICIRSSNNIYNQSFVASQIAIKGKEQAKKWVQGLVKNMARPPKGGDRDQIRAVVAGECDLAVVNSYYFGQMLGSEQGKDREVAEKVRLLWLNQQDRGAHVNISGAGVTTSAKNIDNAKALIEFLLTDSSQQWYADKNYEYPIRAGIEIKGILKQWGDFKADNLALEKLGEYNKDAVKIMDQAGWR